MVLLANITHPQVGFGDTKFVAIHYGRAAELAMAGRELFQKSIYKKNLSRKI